VVFPNFPFNLRPLSPAGGNKQSCSGYSTQVFFLCFAFFSFQLFNSSDLSLILWTHNNLLYLGGRECVRWATVSIQMSSSRKLSV
jgi:hypothetical protein